MIGLFKDSTGDAVTLKGSIAEVVDSNLNLVLSSKGVRVNSDEHAIVPSCNSEVLRVKANETAFLYGVGNHSLATINLATVPYKLEAARHLGATECILNLRVSDKDEVGTILFLNSLFKVKDIIKTAKSYIGVPYKFGGTTPKAFDCSGYLQYVFAQNGVRKAVKVTVR